MPAYTLAITSCDRHDLLDALSSHSSIHVTRTLLPS